MAEFLDSVITFIPLVPLLRTTIVVSVSFIVLNVIIKTIEKNMMKKAHSKSQITNVKIVSRVLHYIVLILLLLFAIFSYTGSWAGLGIGLGLISAGLGFALQKPITGFAAWIMVITKRPFEIGDRVIIGTVKGDVADITPTHIYLHEVGGTVPGDETSGRTILIPNSILFEQNIINYTIEDEFILGQVVVSVTYESNLDDALAIVRTAAKKVLEKHSVKLKKEPYTRTFFAPSSIEIHTRYFVPVLQSQEIESAITKEIYDRFKNSSSLEFAYPHLEVLHRKK